MLRWLRGCQDEEGEEEGRRKEGVDCAEKKIRTPLWMWGISNCQNIVLKNKKKKMRTKKRDRETDR